MTLSERIEDLRARVAEEVDARELAFVAVQCNGCGQTLAVAEDDLTLSAVEQTFAGWSIARERPYIDFCPDCTAKLES